jgi:hypothetical protein
VGSQAPPELSNGVYEAIHRGKRAVLQNSIETDTFNGNSGENPNRFNLKIAKKNDQKPNNRSMFYCSTLLSHKVN